MEAFKKLGFGNNVLKAIKDFNFSSPTEIQEKVIPVALQGHDVIGESSTGSGKTLAFGGPIIEKIKAGSGLKALILTPTRELAQQDCEALNEFSTYSPLKIMAIYGGVSLGPQVQDLEEADIVVGTPGRILDHISRGTINLSKVEFLVLDEADRMLDMGFLPDVTKIIHKCPTNRQTLLFSATISNDILQISKKYMKNPVEISVESYVDPSKLEQVFYEVQPYEKFSLLIHLLKEEDSRLVMVFCNTKRNTDFIGRELQHLGFDALALHGDLSQSQRSRVLNKFHESKKFILVCTDVAARGLDIKEVSHVYNYDCPSTSTDYIHRIGRTARAGKEGKAITLLSMRDFENFQRVISDDSLSIKREELPAFEKVFIKASSNFGNRERFSRGYERNRPYRPRGQPSRYQNRRPDRRFGDDSPTGHRGDNRRFNSEGSRYHSAGRSNSTRGRSFRRNNWSGGGSRSNRR